MASAAKKTFITPEDNLIREKLSSSKSEYRDGVIQAMAGASRPHKLLAANLSRHIGNQLDGRGRELYIADMKVYVQATGSCYDPDFVIACGGPRLEDRAADTLLNPTVIIEILSPSTEATNSPTIARSSRFPIMPSSARTKFWSNGTHVGRMVGS